MGLMGLWSTAGGGRGRSVNGYFDPHSGQRDMAVSGTRMASRPDSALLSRYVLGQDMLSGDSTASCRRSLV